jgi:predicted RNase H-like HicB family nuclease
MAPKYSLIIRWSDEDELYIAWSPEFGTGVKTHGSTYEEAARMGQEVIESWVEIHEADGRPLPRPWTYPMDDESDEILGRRLFPGNVNYRQPPIPSNAKQEENVPT